MRRDIAPEAIEDGRWCNSEGKGRVGARRVYKNVPYAALRARLHRSAVRILIPGVRGTNFDRQL